MTLTPQQRQLAVLGGLFVVIVLVYARAFRRDASASRDASSSPQEEQVLAEALAPEPRRPAGTSSRESQRAYAAALAWKRDPFTLGPSSEGALGMALVGIVWDLAHPMAMINGIPVSVGDEIDGYRVVQIFEDRVVLTDDTQAYQLKLAP